MPWKNWRKSFHGVEVPDFQPQMAPRSMYRLDQAEREAGITAPARGPPERNYGDELATPSPVVREASAPTSPAPLENAALHASSTSGNGARRSGDFRSGDFSCASFRDPVC
jgi:hypothetical protein